MIFKHIIIGADSAGYHLKEQIKEKLIADGYDVTDCGTAVAKAVRAAGPDTCGILVCGTGVGMSMVANKFKGIRAACCSDTFSARMTRAHNDANILCFGARVVGYGLACDLVDAFLGAAFEGGRHQTRVDMIAAIEEEERR